MPLPYIDFLLNKGVKLLFEELELTSDSSVRHERRKITGKKKENYFPAYVVCL